VKMPDFCFVIALMSIASPPQSVQRQMDQEPLHSPATAQLTKCSIVIPVYNEESTVQHLVGLVVDAHIPDGLKREIICVNDCSTDGTAKKLDDLPNLFPQADFKIIHKPVNEGKGATLRDGFRQASGDVVIIQ